jgi:heme/copper-type cytochrome/quinol oxidase subunit 3
MAASAPAARQIEPEPPEWQVRLVRVSGRLICGGITFFFVSFLFAYFYLRALDLNHGWKIGAVHPAHGLGISIMALFLASGVFYRLAAKRAEVDEVAAGVLAVLMGLAAVALQCYEYTILGFGPASGAYASVFFGWTVFYAFFALFGLYAIEVQTATLWRERTGRRVERPAEEVPRGEPEVLLAGVDATSFYWAYFVAIGVLMWIVLYLVG